MDNLDLHKFDSNNNNPQNPNTMVTTQNDHKLHTLLEEMKEAMDNIQKHVHPNTNKIMYSHEEVLAILQFAKDDMHDNAVIESLGGSTSYYMEEYDHVGDLEVNISGSISVELDDIDTSELDYSISHDVMDKEDWIKEVMAMRNQVAEEVAKEDIKTEEA